MQIQLVIRARLEPTFQLQHPNHSATLPPPAYQVGSSTKFDGTYPVNSDLSDG